ncbi:TPA: hypothetical protein DCR79_01750 [Patescibacteria group bacterium]|nr:hypothetical protein [Patescibacteria group bacterium]
MGEEMQHISNGMKKHNIAWIGLSLVLMIVLVGAGCQRRPADDTDNTANTVVNNTTDNSTVNNISNTVTPPTNTIPPSGLPTDPLAILTDLKQEFKDANEAISSLVIYGEQKTDLVLTIVSSKFINTLSDSGLDTNWFIYTSPSDVSNFYLVNMPRPRATKPYKRIIMPKTDFAFDFDVLAIPLEQWKKSYVDALVKAEELGGAKFRSEHKTFEVSTILAYPAAGNQQLSWSVTYKATDGTAALLKVQVNATSGEGVVVQ